MPTNMPRKYLFLFLLLVTLAALAATAPVAEAAAKAKAATSADLWQATLSDYDNAPTFLIAVDKQSQQLFAFERHSPMRLIAEYPVTTGQTPGDKIKSGDLKTPEGVYFVVRHITSGLNYTLYGNEAYPLNYPNPVDKLRKKTGYGIWIHGKGVPLTPRDTQGCVGMNNTDIANLGEKIYIGQPVTLAANITHKPEISQTRAATIAKLERNVLDWAKAWSDRSHRMFDFYDGEAYSVSQGESFKAFRAQKERLFKTLEWIDTKVSDIQILEGPGYWVTWFNQDYRASNLSTNGTRRLYWQQDDSGNLRIVGMEWIPGLKSPVLVASTDKSSTPVPPEVNPALAETGTSGKTVTVAEGKTAPQSRPSVPEIKTDAPGRSATSPETAATPARNGESDVKADTIVAQIKSDAVHQTGRTPLDSAAPAVPAQTGSTDSIGATGGKTSDAAVTASAAKTTAAETAPGSPALAASGKPASAKAPAEQAKQPVESKAEQTKPQQTSTQGMPAGSVSVASIKQPDAVSVTPALPSAQEASALIEKWRTSWEKGDLNAYLSFYSSKATQAGRSFEQMKAQKRKIWQKARPAKVVFEDIRITRTARGFSVKMLQSYTDSRGYSDRGIKTLLIEADGKTMRIMREDWTPEI